MIRKSATIQDVARAAGVSTATVSRVLSAPDRVAEETREAVLEAIRSTGYRVNQAARNLRKQRAGSVLVLVPDLGIPFYSGILSGVSAGFAGSDYSVLISDTKTTPLKADGLAGFFLDGRIDGALCLDGGISNESLQDCAARGLDRQIVFLCEWAEGTKLPYIASDNTEGGRLAVRHLHELGHTKIAHVTGPMANVVSRARLDGMRQEQERLGIPARPEFIIPGDFSVESGENAARAILAMTDRPTAVFCSADMVAVGLMATLQAAGLRIPQDISVVGFDDIELAEFTVPALTTIRQDRQRLGRRAAAVLLEQLSLPEAQHRMEPLIPVDLVVRASSGPAPA